PRSTLVPYTTLFRSVQGERQMRIAVCLSGAERLESDAFTLFTRNLPADAEADCFAFFWEGGPLSDEAALAELINTKTEGRYGSVERKRTRLNSSHVS